VFFPDVGVKFVINLLLATRSIWIPLWITFDRKSSWSYLIIINIKLKHFKRLETREL